MFGWKYSKDIYFAGERLIDACTEMRISAPAVPAVPLRDDRPQLADHDPCGWLMRGNVALLLHQQCTGIQYINSSCSSLVPYTNTIAELYFAYGVLLGCRRNYGNDTTPEKFYPNFGSIGWFVSD